MDPTCPECRARVAADQRYCLDCGHRVGVLRLDWRALLSERASAVRAASPSPPAIVAALPTPRVAATLLLIVMGFGVVIAGAASSDVPRALASASRPPLTIVLPPRPTAAPPAPEPAPEPAAPAPAPQPAPAPEPAAAPPAPDPAPAPAAEPDKPVIADPVASGPDVPPVKHVFVISLGPGTYDQWFGEQSTVPYLTELAAQGTLLSSYEATSDGELANEITQISGQPATAQAEADCPAYTPVDQGDGCVHTLEDYTLPDQLVAAGSTWKAYIEGQDAPGADPGSCRHPEDGQPDPFASPREGDRYVTWRNPFVYFQTITTTPDCAASDVGLTPLDTDLAKRSTTATFSWIAPSVDNHAPANAEPWLRTVVPKILASKAYADGALLAIVPDASGVPEDRRTGALLLGRYVPAGGIATDRLDHRSLLKGVEDLFGLRHLPGVAPKKVKSFVSLLLH